MAMTEERAREMLKGICGDCGKKAELTIANPRFSGGESPRGNGKGLRSWDCETCENSWDEHTVVDGLYDAGFGEEGVKAILGIREVGKREPL